MNLANALKNKNRLVGQLNKLQNEANQYNVTQVTSSEPVFKLDLSAVWKSINDVRAQILSLKIAIAQASAGIAHKLVELAECKSDLSFLNGLTIRSGRELETHYAKDYSVFASYIDLNQQRNLIDSAQNRINRLQDEIDSYNASTIVSL